MNWSQHPPLRRSAEPEDPVTWSSATGIDGRSERGLQDGMAEAEAVIQGDARPDTAAALDQGLLVAQPQVDEGRR